MDNVKKPKWWDEFTAFAIKGNAMALAVGTIIGAAFSTITKSLTDDVIMPIVSIFIGGVDFSEMKLVLPRLFTEKYDDAGNVIQNTLNYGNFISAVINFLILALVVFFLVKGLNKMSELGKKKEEVQEEKKERSLPRKKFFSRRSGTCSRRNDSPSPIAAIKHPARDFPRAGVFFLKYNKKVRILWKNGLTNPTRKPIITYNGSMWGKTGGPRLSAYIFREKRGGNPKFQKGWVRLCIKSCVRKN